MKVSGWVAAKYRCDNILLRFARGIMIPVRYGIDRVEPGTNYNRSQFDFNVCSYIGQRGC
jgi:hypothetical protein